VINPPSSTPSLEAVGLSADALRAADGLLERSRRQ
jgi:hypothetical protein